MLMKIMRRKRIVSKVLLYFLPVGVSLALVQCSFRKPSAPSWDTQLTIPLINRVYTISELIEDSENIKADAQGLISLSFELEMDTIRVEDNLKISGVEEHFSSEIGKFNIEPPGGEEVDILFSRVYPRAVLYHGAYRSIEPFQFRNVMKDVPQFSNFVSAELESGGIVLDIRNGLPVPLGGDVSIALLGTGTRDTISVASLGQDLLPGRSRSIKLDLAGKVLGNRLSISLSGSSPGSKGSKVFVDANSSITIAVNFTELTVVSATAVVPQQHFSDWESFTLSDTIIITEAEIESGSLGIVITNNTPLDLSPAISFDNIVSDNGNILEIFVPVGSGQTAQYWVELGDYALKPERISGNTSAMRFSWDVGFGSHDRMVTIKSSDFIDIHLSMPQLVFRRIEGRLNALEIGFDPMEETMDIPSELDSLQFDQVLLEFDINNGFGFSVTPDLLLTGFDSDTGDSVNILVNEKIPSHSMTTLTFDKNNSNIVEFLNNWPDRIIIRGRVYVGDAMEVSSLSSEDFITGKVRIEAPFSLSFPTNVIDTDVDTVNMNKDSREVVREDLQGGRLAAIVENHLPFGVEVEMRFSARDTMVYENPQLIIGPISIRPGEFDPETGKVISSVISNIDIELTHEDLLIFDNPEVYTGILITIPGTGGTLVRVYDSDFVGIKAYVVIRGRLGHERFTSKE